MAPDAPGEHEVGRHAEAREVEVGVVRELWPARFLHARLEQRGTGRGEALLCRLDAVVVPRVEEVDEPVARPERATAHVDDVRLGRHAAPHERDEHEPTVLLEALDARPHELRPAELLRLAL